MISLDHAETELLKKISYRDKFNFILVFVTGMITHFMLYSELLTTGDGIWQLLVTATGDYERSLGRWAIPIVDFVKFRLNSPIVMIFFAMIALSLSSVMINRMLGISSYILIILSSITMITFPVWCMMFNYTYTADSYAFAMLCAVVSVFCWYCGNGKKRIFFSILFLILTLGLYQAFLGVIIGFGIWLIIANPFYSEGKSRKKLSLSFLGIISGGGIGYYSVTHIILRLYNISASSYGGADSIGIKSSLVVFPKRIVQTYKTFFDYYFTDEIVHNIAFYRREILYIFFFALMMVCIVMLTIEKRMKFVELVILGIGIITFPIWLNCIELIAVSRNTNLLMSAPLLLPLLIGISLVEKLCSENHFEIIVVWITIICISLIAFSNYIMDNATYLAVKENMNKIFADAVSVKTRMEMQDGYSNDLPVIFAGSVQYSFESDIYDISDWKLGQEPVVYKSSQSYSGVKGTWERYWNFYLGEPVHFASDEIYSSIVSTKEFEEMDVYPNANSVKIISDVIVVKFTEDPLRP